MKKQGFTLIELLLLVAIMATLSAILFPVFSRASKAARKRTCLSNVSQIALACLMYAEDNDDYLPIGYHDGWDRLGRPNADAYDGIPMYSCMAQGVFPYIGDPYVFHCPNFKKMPNAYCYPTTDPITDGKPGATFGWSCYDETGGDYYAIDDPATTLLLLCAPFNEKRVPMGTRWALVDWSKMPKDKTAKKKTYLSPGEFWPGNVFDAYHAGNDISSGSLLIQDPSDWSRPAGELTWLLQIHNRGTNYGYCDGHAEWHRFSQTRTPVNQWTRYGGD